MTSPQNAGLSAPLRGQGSFSFMTAGNRETSVNFMINGINLNDLSNSQVTFQPSINTVSEFKVDNSTFSAEYGRNSGAIVNVATRSGANQFHGEGVRLLPRPEVRLAQLLQPASRRRSRVVQPQAVRRQPRRTDREEQDVLLRQLRRAAPPQAVDLNSGHAEPTRSGRRSPTRSRRTCSPYIPVGERSPPARASIGSALAPVNIDQYTGDVRTQSAAERRPARLLRVPARHPPRAERAGQHRARVRRHARRPPADLTVNETHVFSQALVNEVRVGFNRINISFAPNTLVDTGALGINVGLTANPVALPQITISGLGLNFGGPSGFPSGREVTTVAVGDTATYLHGSHIVKFGGEFPPREAYTASRRSRHGSRIRALRHSSRDSATRSEPRSATRRSTPT